MLYFAIFAKSNCVRANRPTIAINTRLVIEGKMDGIGWFTYETARRLARSHSECDFIFLFDRPFDVRLTEADNVRGEVVHLPTRHPLLIWLWFDWCLPRFFARHPEIDLFVSPDGLVSLRSEVRQLAVLHDINFYHHPQEIPFAFRHYYNHFIPKMAQRADRLATVSEYSKSDIVETYGIPPDMIDVVYNGVNPRYRPAESREAVREIRVKYAAGRPYFLFIGTILPRKNLANMIRAFDRFRRETGEDVQFLIAGNKKWWNGDLTQALVGLQNPDSVRFLGPARPPQLTELLAGAFALLYCTRFEGFGIPILEGMSAGVPVVTSAVTSMPEVAADAALLADPTDPAGIARQMLRLWREPGLRRALVEKGFVRAADFSWERTAELLWGSIERTLNQAPAEV